MTKTQARLERLRNYETLYELVMERGGDKYLVIYCAQGRYHIIRAIRRHGAKIVQMTGVDTIDSTAHGATAVMGDWQFYFSGRTEREAIRAGELPFIGDLPKS